MKARRTFVYIISILFIVGATVSWLYSVIRARAEHFDLDTSVGVAAVDIFYGVILWAQYRSRNKRILSSILFALCLLPLAGFLLLLYLMWDAGVR